MRTNRFLPAALCIILSLVAPVAGAPGGKLTSADRHARAERQLTEHIAAPAHGRISILIANIHAQSHEHADAAADPDHGRVDSSRVSAPTIDVRGFR